MASATLMFWQLTDDDLILAQAGDTGAAQRVFANALPTCERIALALCGTRPAARRVVKEVAKRGARQFDRWRAADDAGRWFMHHTILLTRRSRKPVEPKYDILLEDVGGPDVVQYQAMIAALRNLPPQQLEAFVLTHAQRWNTRLCAVAMDCSNKAVENHLAEANRQMTPLLAKNVDLLTAALAQVYKSLPLDLPVAPETIAFRVRTGRSVRRVTRLVGWIVMLALIAAITVAAIYLKDRIDV